MLFQRRLENLAVGTGAFAFQDAVNMRMGEECGFYVNCERGARILKSALADYEPKNPVGSHFTQVVWKSTTQVGCAQATCNGIYPESYGVCSSMPVGILRKYILLMNGAYILR